MSDSLKIDYMKTPLYRYTFKNRRIRKWVEDNCEGRTLNLFSGPTKLSVDEIRNDLDKTMPADYHLDALQLVEGWQDGRFDTILLDPPYALRKSMELYKGHITSPFNALKDVIPDILNSNGIVITFGYHSCSMGKKRGFSQERLLILYHGGAIHDTLAIKERFNA